MIDRILKLRKRVLKSSYNPDYLVCNELELRRIRDSFNDLFDKNDSWKEVIGSTLFGMVIFYDPDCVGIKILYNTSEQTE